MSNVKLTPKRMNKQPKRDISHTSFNHGVEQRRRNVGIGASRVMRITLHHPLRPQLHRREKNVRAKKEKQVIRAL